MDTALRSLPHGLPRPRRRLRGGSRGRAAIRLGRCPARPRGLLGHCNEKSLGQGLAGGGRGRAHDAGRVGRSGRLQQDGHCRRRRSACGQPRWARRPLRCPRARHGRGDERDGAARRRSPLRRDLPDLLRLHAARHPSGGADGSPRHLRLHPRQHRPGRGRAHASTGRAARRVAGHPRPSGPAPGRWARDRGSVASRPRVQDGTVLPVPDTPDGPPDRPGTRYSHRWTASTRAPTS